MKLDKQLNALECLNSGKYLVVNDQVLTYHKTDKIWNVLKYRVLPSGYAQYTIFNSKRSGNNIKLMIYRHILIYLSNNGVYLEGWQIDHVDRDKANNLPGNLVAKPAVDNIANSERLRTNVVNGLRVIRHAEIQDIKDLLAEGLSQSAIARQLDLNRLSVRYTIKRLQSGLPMKYDNVV